MPTIWDIYNPLLKHFRRPRMALFCRLFGISKDTRVLDVGGSQWIWELAPVKPKLTILNLYATNGAGGAKYVRADGCEMPFADNAFDVVFCNSVIEHLGNWSAIERFAEEVSRVGRRYWVQTPNRNFPLEPHYLGPLVHYLPKEWQKRIFRYGTGLGLLTKPSKEEISQIVDELCLLTSRDLRQLFPRATIRIERFAGLAKSLIAAK